MGFCEGEREGGRDFDGVWKRGEITGRRRWEEGRSGLDGGSAVGGLGSITISSIDRLANEHWKQNSGIAGRAFDNQNYT